LHQNYALEGFLARLVVSPYADRLVRVDGDEVTHTPCFDHASAWDRVSPVNAALDTP
jgi:hypothetical protein